MDAINPDYKALEPRKSRRGRAIRRLLQYWIARAVIALTARLTVPMAQRIGRWVGRIGYRLERAERKVCEYQMAMVFPQVSPADRTRMIRACFEHLGMTAVEVLAMPRIRRESGRWLTITGEDALREAHAKGKGVVLVTGHCGNWELLPLAADMLQIPMTAVVRVLHNARLNELLLNQRTTPYMEIAQRGTQGSARLLLKALKEGRALIVAIDQDIDAQSVYADFLGRPAKTPRVAANLALRYGVPIVTVFDERLADGTHRLDFQVIPASDAAHQAPIEEQALIQQLNDRISAQILRVPEQWGWNHRRWLHQPQPAGRAEPAP